MVELLYIKVRGRRGSSSTERRWGVSPDTAWWDNNVTSWIWGEWGMVGEILDRVVKRSVEILYRVVKRAVSTSIDW